MECIKKSKNKYIINIILRFIITKINMKTKNKKSD